MLNELFCKQSTRTQTVKSTVVIDIEITRFAETYGFDTVDDSSLMNLANKQRKVT